ncbi:MAG: hypothetical protein I8H76_05300 [Burkholderiales bacterium]|nr:hypothetical protein [Burkholderiales bacterium]MBH2015170.1 hypothetical protein [Burkholderiales bacterium]
MVDRAIDHPLTPKRRWFLKTALFIGAVGASLGGLVYWHRGMDNGKLTEHGRDVLRGLAIGIVGPMLPKDAAQRDAILEGHLAHVEVFLNGMPNVLQIEVNAILGLLGNLPTRKMLTGMSSAWSEASQEDIARALETMRMNPLPTTRLTYQVVRAVTCMAFFSNSDHWQLTGYPGPIEL